MAIQVKAVVRGATELERKLKGLPRRVRGRPLARALRKAMQPVRSAVRRAIPRDTGNMARSVRIVVKRLRGRFAGMVAKLGFGRRGAQANLLELGTTNQDGSQRITPTHDVRDEFRSQEDQLAERFQEELLSMIMRELRK